MSRHRAKADASQQRLADDVPWIGGLLAGVLIATIWSYWDTLRLLWHDWQGDANYSVGQLVPLAAVYLLWHDRRAILQTPRATCWWGVPVLIAAQAIRFGGQIFVIESIERYSVVLTLAGLTLLLGGMRLVWRTKWVLVFLLLMIPLPGRVHNAISGPLQGYATSGTAFVLELVGVTVSREGNILVLNETTRIAVVEACSGLRMLTAFVVVASVLAYIVNRPAWQRATLVVSSIPVAIICNLVRLLVTAVLFMVTTSDLADRFFHDFAGVTMMPLAVLLLLGELWLMARLIIDEPVNTRAGPAARKAARVSERPQ